MRGVPEKRLKVIAAMPASVFEAPASEIINYLIAKECQELQEPWILIDKNAPRDKFILCWIDDLQNKYILKFSTARNTWLDQGLRPFMKPDLYQELPDDPV